MMFHLVSLCVIPSLAQLCIHYVMSLSLSLPLSLSLYIYIYLAVEDHFRNVLYNGTIIFILTTMIWIWLHDADAIHGSQLFIVHLNQDNHGLGLVSLHLMLDSDSICRVPRQVPLHQETSAHLEAKIHRVEDSR